jgi:hypothetical protein
LELVFHKKVVEWFEKAAKQGHAPQATSTKLGLYNLGLIYTHGRGKDVMNLHDEGRRRWSGTWHEKSGEGARTSTRTRTHIHPARHAGAARARDQSGPITHTVSLPPNPIYYIRRFLFSISNNQPRNPTPTPPPPVARRSSITSRHPHPHWPRTGIRYKLCEGGLIPRRHKEGHIRQPLSNWDA